MNTADLLMDSQNVLGKFPLFYRMRRLTLLEPRAQVAAETTSFEVKIVSDPSELKEVFRLRYDVFFREFAGRKNRFTLLPFDVDLHDFSCDHLIVKDKKTGSIVATYRLLFQEEGVSTNFYTESEFDLSGFRKLSGNKLELGRACVHSDYRNGTVISLLWKGLCQYARKTQTRYMFGCSSVSRSEFASVPYIHQQLKKRDAVLTEFETPVRSSYSLSAYPLRGLPQISATECDGSMPSLMNMYLLAGAKMSLEMAYDEEMDCLDFFTVLNFSCLPPSFERRFA